MVVGIVEGMVVLRVIRLHGVGGGVLKVSFGRVNEVSPHHTILACAFPKLFEVTRERSGVGVSEDVVQLRNDVSGGSLNQTSVTLALVPQ